MIVVENQNSSHFNPLVSQNHRKSSKSREEYDKSIPRVCTRMILQSTPSSSPTFVPRLILHPLIWQPPFKSRSNTERTSNYLIPGSKIRYTDGCTRVRVGLEEARIAAEAGTRKNERTSERHRLTGDKDSGNNVPRERVWREGRLKVWKNATTQNCDGGERIKRAVEIGS